MNIKQLKNLIKDNKDSDIVLSMGKDEDGNFFVTTQSLKGYEEERQGVTKAHTEKAPCSSFS